MGPSPNASGLDLDFLLMADVEAPPGITADDLAQIARFVLENEAAVGTWEVTVALVGDARLQALHREFLGIDEPTDVMTFPVTDKPDASGGELAISVDHATTQAAAWGLTPADEIRFLVVHGMLHLLGWRDDDDAQRASMLERQQALFDQWRGAHAG
jgi:probable rRNA maturation factor